MDNQPRLTEFLSPKSDNMVRATIDRRISELVTAYPKLRYGQLMMSIFRSNGEIQGDPFYWNDAKTLKRVETISKQLSLSYNTESGDFDDEFVDETFMKERITSNPTAYNK